MGYTPGESGEKYTRVEATQQRNPALQKWPYEISQSAFRDAWVLEGESLWTTVFEMHQKRMQIKNINIALPNLEKIFTATFRLANSKGFQAMSLRDLSRETNISMGGIYSYIGSKNELASVIEEVLRHYVDQVVVSLSELALHPVHQLKAIIYGDLYMNDILSPWYYFCFMEAKGLPRDQQERSIQLELKFENMLVGVIQRGIKMGIFHCQHPDLLASHATGMVQQWYVKRWKFKRRQTQVQTYARFVFETLLQNLECRAELIPQDEDRETLSGVSA